MNLNIRTSELLEIHKYIGREGDDVFLPLAQGLEFKREKGICYISLGAFFAIPVDRLEVYKTYVKFYNSENKNIALLISRTGKSFYE